MRERPILFSGPMVRAILEGRKTQTRRVVKGPRVRLRHHVQADPPYSEPKAEPGAYLAEMNPHGAVSIVVDGRRLGVKPGEFDFVCPYGEGHTFLRMYPNGRKVWTIDPGGFDSRLWVRETWRESELGTVLYRATEPGTGGDAWYPSIHMPRWASRLTLELTGVRVERLQDISEEDGKAEGLVNDEECEPDSLWWIEKMQLLWDGLNASRGFGWESNPWVWVLEFKRAEAAEVAA